MYSFALQTFFKRSTVYIPMLLVGAYFSNEVSLSSIQRVLMCAFVQAASLLQTVQGIDYAVNKLWTTHNKGVSQLSAAEA